MHADLSTFGAGRTDAGVHALGQVISVPDAPDHTDLARLRDALNGICGPSIAISGCAEAKGGWHARFDARSRLYVYAILEGEVPDPFLALTTFRHREALDVETMNEASGYEVGDRDFSAFGRVSESGASARRTLFELNVSRHGRLTRVRARANSFIQQMVRSLVGTLIQVGEGRREPDSLIDVLHGQDRALAGPVAPPHGLCLVSVEYDQGWSRPIDLS